jgi:hypothetical protein
MNFYKVLIKIFLCRNQITIHARKTAANARAIRQGLPTAGRNFLPAEVKKRITRGILMPIIPGIMKKEERGAREGEYN